MGTTCVPLVADLFYTAMKEISWILLTMIIKLMLSNTDNHVVLFIYKRINDPTRFLLLTDR